MFEQVPRAQGGTGEDRDVWREVLDQAPVPVAFLSAPELRFEFVNEAFAELFGGRALLGHPAHEVVPLVGTMGHVEMLEGVLASGEPFQDRELQLVVAGHERFVNASCRAYRDEVGAIRGVILTVVDVSAWVIERRSTVETLMKLRQVEAQTQAILEHAPVPVFVKDLDGRLLLVNRAFARHMRRDPADLVGLGDAQIIGPMLAQDTTSNDRKVVESRAPMTFEERVPDADGHVHWWLTTKFPIFDDAGDMVGIGGICADLSDRRRLEEARELFIGILGHDLRNPLNTVRVGTEALVASGGLDSAARRIVARMVAACDRMHKMISDIMDWTRSRLGGGFPIEAGPVDLSVICDRAVDETRGAHPARDLRFERSGPTDGYWDGDRIAQVVANLIGNAIQHGDPGEPMWVRLRGDADEVTLEVKNGGDPIPADLLPHLFEPFQRLEHRRSQGSIGLGLYIVREIVRAHGGRIEVESTASCTCFRVALPRRR